jgi:hypothetical protein
MHRPLSARRRCVGLSPDEILVQLNGKRFNRLAPVQV